MSLIADMFVSLEYSGVTPRDASRARQRALVCFCLRPVLSTSRKRSPRVSSREGTYPTSRGPTRSDLRLFDHASKIREPLRLRPAAWTASGGSGVLSGQKYSLTCLYYLGGPRA